MRLFFFFNDTATTEIYTLSLHDALPILASVGSAVMSEVKTINPAAPGCPPDPRSEEHTSELQSQSNLVCRLLLEKKKKHLLGLQVHLDAVGFGAERAGRASQLGVQRMLE